MSLSPSVVSYLNEIDPIPGWFGYVDVAVFDALLSHQEDHGVRGDLLEIGAYWGRSAVVLGLHRQAGERVVVCDLFENSPATAELREEWQRDYGGLTEAAFLSTYQRFVPDAPHIVARPSNTLQFDVPAASCRFVHVDGSHRYEDADADIRFSMRSITADGVIAIDDYRSVHTPGVAAAAWQAVIDEHMAIACLTEAKMYLADPETATEIRSRVRAVADGLPSLDMEAVPLLGQEPLRLWMRT